MRCSKAILRGEFSNKQQTLCLKQLEKQEQTKPKVRRRKEIIKIRAEINEIKTKIPIEKINETTSSSFENINKIDKPLARIIKKNGRGPETIKSEMKKKL